MTDPFGSSVPPPPHPGGPQMPPPPAGMAPPPGYVAYGGPGAYSPTKPIRGLTTWLRILLIGSLVVTALTLVAFGGTRVGGSSQDVAEQFRDQLQVTILSSVVSVATAVVFILLVRQLAVRHMKATGEAR